MVAQCGDVACRRAIRDRLIQGDAEHVAYQRHRANR